MKFFCLSSFLLSYAIVSYAQVELLTDIVPGTGYANIQYLTKFQGKVFFFAGLSSSSNAVWRLYKTDGTVAGTEIVYESDSLNMQNGEPRNVAVAGNKMYFITKKDWLWVTDGTNAGTMPLQAFYRNDTLQYLDDLVAADNGYAYVSLSNKGLGRINTATNTIDTFYNKFAGVEIIYSLNGTAFTITNPYTNTAETGIFDLNQSKFLLRKSVDSFSIKQYPLSAPDVCIHFLNGSEFIAFSQGFSDAPELPVRIYKYNMQNDTKVLLAEEPEATTGSGAARATADGKVFWAFRRAITAGGQGLVYVTDGTVGGTYTLDPPGKFNYVRPSAMKAYNDKVLFTIQGNEAQSNRYELWITDGTLPGTVKLTQSVDTLSTVSAGNDTLGGYMYFENNTNELWRTDGTVNGTTLICDTNRLQGFDEIKNLNGTMVFESRDITCVGNEVWAYVPGNACSINVTCPAGVNALIAGNLKIYPNPAISEVSVEIPQGEEVIELALLSMDGKALRQKQVISAGIQRVSLTDLSDGMYLLKLQTTKGCYTSRLLLQR
jgi:ELWxxDGT repeat protein